MTGDTGLYKRNWLDFSSCTGSDYTHDWDKIVKSYGSYRLSIGFGAGLQC